MAQKNSRKSATRASQNHSEQSKFSLQTFLAGLIIGALGMHFLPILLDNKDSITEPTNETITQTIKPTFQFPDILAGTEIAVPNRESEPAQETNVAFLLQVGSFINQRDAESLRVRLLLLNFKAFVEPFETDTGDIYTPKNLTPAETKQLMDDIMSLQSSVPNTLIQPVIIIRGTAA